MTVANNPGSVMVGLVTVMSNEKSTKGLVFGLTIAFIVIGIASIFVHTLFTTITVLPKQGVQVELPAKK